MSDPPITVLLVDDQPLIRLGLETLLCRKRDIKIIGHATNGLEAIQQVATLDPDVVLMDLRMPQLDGIQATQQLVASGTRAAIIILTTFDDDQDIFNGLAAGARGYLLKDVDPHTLVAAVRAAASGKALLQPEVTDRLLQEFRRLRDAATTPQTGTAPGVTRGPQTPSIVEILTERERDILRLMAQGQSNQEIGQALVISIGTVKNHVSNILSKLGARDRMQAVLLAQQFGLV